MCLGKTRTRRPGLGRTRVSLAGHLCVVCRTSYYHARSPETLSMNKDVVQCGQGPIECKAGPKARSQLLGRERERAHAEIGINTGRQAGRQHKGRKTRRLSTLQSITHLPTKPLPAANADSTVPDSPGPSAPATF
jgi:hypothetical protein